MKPTLSLLLAALLAAPAALPAQTAEDTSDREGVPAWEVRPPGDHGFDTEDLARAFARADSLRPLTSLLVARDTTLVAERYWRGAEPHRGVNIKSASKAILSAVVGIALERGDVESPDQPVADFFPEFFDRKGADPRKRGITIRHLLTMTAGLETTSFHNYGAWVTRDDWALAALERPMVARPGSRMIYSTGNTHLLSVILARASGESTLAYARRHLFGPLGVDVDAWQRSPRGHHFGGNNMRISPREMLRFGQLYLNGGRWRGRQIVPEPWVEESWRAYTRSERFGYDFGYCWWSRDLAGHRVHYAWGYGGQFIFVVPQLRLVVVATSTSTPRRSGGSSHLEAVYELLRHHLLPAAEG